MLYDRFMVSAIKVKALSTRESHAIMILRGLAILNIVGFRHMLNYTDTDWPLYFITESLAYISLCIFMLFSGYLLFPKAVSQSPAAFYKNRFVRIYPLFLLAVACFWIVGIYPFSILAKTALLTSVYALPSPITLWFVVILCHYYVLTPLLARCTESAIRMIAVVGTYLGLHLLLLGLNIDFDMRIIAFFPAYVSGLLFRRYVKYTHRKLWMWVLAAILCVAVPAIFVTFPHMRLAHYIPMSIVVPFVCFLLLSRCSTKVITQLMRPVTYALLPLYLFHRVVFTVLTDMYFPTETLWQIFYLVGFCLPVILGISYGIQAAYNHGVQKSPYGSL